MAREADLLAALSPQGGVLRKIVSPEAAAEQVERWRRRGLRIGFTNGCFDLLQARARASAGTGARGLRPAGGRARTTDASVRRLKGAGRPVQPQDERAAAVLAALPSVDLVVVAEDDDAGRR